MHWSPTHSLRHLYAISTPWQQFSLLVQTAWNNLNNRMPEFDQLERGQSGIQLDGRHSQYTQPHWTHIPTHRIPIARHSCLWSMLSEPWEPCKNTEIAPELTKADPLYAISTPSLRREMSFGFYFGGGSPKRWLIIAANGQGGEGHDIH